MTLEIIGFAQSNFVRTIRMIAEEKGVPYEHISAFPGSQEARAAHPLGQVPAMRHDGFELFESIAIAHYIESTFDGGSLMVGTPQGDATIEQWIALVTTTIDQFFMRRYVVEYTFNKDADGNPVRTLIDPAIKRFKRLFATLEAAVAPGYLGSATFTMADCFLAPIMAAALNFPEAKEFYEGCPNLQAWMGRMNERPSFQNTAA